MKPYTNSQMDFLIREYIHKARDRRILKRRLIDGATFDELAEEFDMSVQGIKRIVYKNMAELVRHI